MFSKIFIRVPDSSEIVTTTSMTSSAPNGNLQTNTSNSGSISFQQRRGSLQLWQFLISLLEESPGSSKLVMFNRSQVLKHLMKM